MGEAKRKREAADQQGTTTKQLTRGLVVSPPIVIDGSSLYAKSTVLDPQELRCATLLWDKIVWPSSRAIHFASGPDEQFLEQAGFLTRPDYTVMGDGAQGIAHGQVAAFNDLDRREPGVWSLAQGENSFLLKSGVVLAGGNAQFHLMNAVPVPHSDVPLAEVLEFKIHRRDELFHLRQEIEVFVSNLNNADDKEAELRRSVSEIDRACADAIKVGREWQFPVKLVNLKIAYKYRPFQTIAGAMAGVFGSKIPNLSATEATLAGIGGGLMALSSFLEITHDSFEWRGLRDRQNPYRYVYDFHNVLF